MRRAIAGLSLELDVTDVGAAVGSFDEDNEDSNVPHCLEKAAREVGEGAEAAEVEKATEEEDSVAVVAPPSVAGVAEAFLELFLEAFVALVTGEATAAAP